MRRTWGIILFCGLMMCTACGMKEEEIKEASKEPPAAEEVTEEPSKEDLRREKITAPFRELLDRKELELNFQAITAVTRKRGTEGNRQAGEFIRNKMESYGYEVSFQEFDGYRSTVIQMYNDFWSPNPNNEAPLFRGRNIIVKPKKVRAELPTVVFTAHYDTTTDNIGAFDNASGVVTMMEVARIIQNADLPYNPEFVFFDSEEYYIQGSRHFLRSLSEEERAKIVLNFNVDMVGNRKARSLIFVNSEGDPLREEVKRTLSEFDVRFDIWGMSDDVAFEAWKIPNFRYTSVDTFSKEFDPSVFTKEHDRSWVEMEMLAEDVHLIGTFALRTNPTQEKKKEWQAWLQKTKKAREESPPGTE